MKKITAFFMALMPLLITVLLFAAGLIVKNSTHVYVQSVSINHDSIALQVTDESKPKEYKLETTVIPTNATNPDIFWTTSDENIVEVNSEGNIKTKGYGEAYVYATSKENPLIQAKCAIEVWDDRIHHINIKNQYNAEQLAYNQVLKLEPEFIPSTHLLDKSLTYKSSNEDAVKVFPDGTLKASDGINGTSTITVETASETAPKVTKTFDVKVSPGVIKLDLKDQTQTIIADKSYNVKEQIVSYPDKNTKADDFAYSVDDETIASVDDQGIVTFHKEGEVLVTAKYKRNEELTVTKSIKSTFDHVKEIYFNRYEFKDSLTKYQNKDLPISYTTFPTTLDNSKIKFESSNTNVVNPVFEDNKWTFKAVGAGSAVLKSTINVDGAIEESDFCLVTLTSNDIAGKIFKQPIIDSKSLYYSIRDNLNTDIYSTLQNPEWSVESDGDVVALDSDNLILHAKENVQEAKVNLKVGLYTYSFKINFNNEMADLPSEETEFKIQVGQKCQFDGYLLRSNHMSDETFDMETSGIGGIDIMNFIPKKGGVYEASLYSNLPIPVYQKDIKLIVEEKPVDISLAINNPHYVTLSDTVNVVNTFMPQVVPTSAYKADGTSYKIDYQYELEEQIVKQENNVLTFLQSGNAIVGMSIDGTINKVVSIHSTCGDVGKFTLKDGTTDIVSGDTIQIPKGQSKTLTLNEIFTNVPITGPLVNQFIIESKNGSKLTSKIEFNDATQKIDFTFASSTQGMNNIVIKTGTFNFYLNVNVSSEVEKIALYNKGKELQPSKIANVAVFSNTFNLDVVAEPITADAGKIKATIQKGEDPEKELTISTTNRITITPEILTGYGLYTIKLSAENSLHETVESIYNIDYKEKITKADVIIPEADANGNLYIEATSTQSFSTIYVNAIVEDDFYKDFTVKFGDKEGKIVYNKIVFTDIPSPTDANPEYESDIVLSYTKEGSAFEKKLHLSRDIVTRIELPKHDNLDMTDKKGLQKVHVYGNRSWYDDAEKTVDYYKLPIDLYNYRGAKIEDTAMKEKAYNSLTVSFSDGKSTAKYNSKGFIEVRFAKESLYSYQEIFDDAFDSKVNKNVTINLTNKTNITNSQYTFVSVDGVNVYTEQGLMSLSGRASNYEAVVLQTSYGLEDVEKDNVKWQNVYEVYSYMILYGNGYTLNFDKKTMSQPDQGRWTLKSAVCINATLEGTYDRNLSWVKQSAISLNEFEGWECPVSQHYLFKYNIAKNWSEGLDPDNRHPDKDVLIQNCLFYRAINSCINVGWTNTQPTLYLENCVFFDCATFPIMATQGAKVYFKGMIDIYNFHSSDMFTHLMGPTLSQQLFNIMIVAARAAKMSQVGADGREYINSFMVTGIDKELYFWNGKEYVKDVKGNPFAANYTGKYIDLRLPDYMPEPYKGLEASLWSTENPTPGKPSPSYYDEFDKDGNLRFDFLSNQINKLVRKIKYF